MAGSSGTGIWPRTTGSVRDTRVRSQHRRPAIARRTAPIASLRGRVASRPPTGRVAAALCAAGGCAAVPRSRSTSRRRRSCSGSNRPTRRSSRASPDIFMAGYGFVWLPPPYRADQGGFSVGYDVYDRFDLGRPGQPDALRHRRWPEGARAMLHRAGVEPARRLRHQPQRLLEPRHPGLRRSGRVSGVRDHAAERCRRRLPLRVRRRRRARAAGRPDRHRAREEPPLHPQPGRAGQSEQPARGHRRRLRPAGERARPAKPSFYPDIGHSTIFAVRPANGRAEHRRPWFNLDESDGRRPGRGERDRLSDAQRAVAGPGRSASMACGSTPPSTCRASCSTSSIAPSTARTRDRCSTAARSTCSPTARSSTPTRRFSFRTSRRRSIPATPAASAATATRSTSSSTSR